MKKIPFLRDKLIVNTLTFHFNPFKIDDRAESLKSFLDIYYARSDLLFIPNLKAARYDKVAKKREIIVEKEDYVDYVDMAYTELSFRNSKPIFTPLPLKYGIIIYRDVLRKYLDSGYRYFWLDLEGSSSSAKAIWIRAFRQVVEDYGVDDKTLLHVTNVRRERNPHSKEERSEPSDILAAPLGADFVGVNREPQRAPEGAVSPALPPGDLFDHKARFLDRTTYYYTKYSAFDKRAAILQRFGVPEEVIRKNPKFYSSYINSFEINNEFDIHRKLIMEEDSVWDYLKTKKSLPNNTLDDLRKVTRKNPQHIDLSDYI